MGGYEGRQEKVRDRGTAMNRQVREDCTGVQELSQEGKCTLLRGLQSLGPDASPAIGCPRGKVHFGQCPHGSRPQPSAAHPGMLRPQSSHMLEGGGGTTHDIK